jgi:hypothetical protein
MFKTQNFCHIASNNRNQVKAGVFVYRTTENLATVSASGYFNARIIDINLHDLIIYEKIDASDATKVERNVLCVTERTLENVGVTVIKSKWEGDIEQEIADLKTYVDNNFVNIDGSSIMSGPLKFRAGSFEGAIAGGLGDGISVYKMNADGSINSEVAALTKTNGFVPGTTNAMNIGSSSLKWKDAYIGRVITSVLNNGADINVPTTGGTLALKSDIGIGTANITNCITEIPQDIKLELNNGTLTLKAGSKAYVPNGAGVFNTISIITDKTTGSISVSDGQYLMLCQNDGGIATAFTNVSGSTQPGSPTNGMVWYDTVNNLVKRYWGGTWYSNYSLPFALVAITNGAVSSINQVFNGFGYIGSTIYMLPGVKGLIPNGRNADGTLNNLIMNNTSVKTKTITTSFSAIISIGSSAGFDTYAVQNYNPETNYNYNSTGNLQRLSAGTVKFGSGGVVQSFNPKQPFHAVDYNDYKKTVSQVDTNTANIALKQDEATAVNYDNITNCITEIPQDIKLELNGGTLTLKAGSKVYVPNGSGVFNTVTTTQDISVTISGVAGQYYIYKNPGNNINYQALATIVSGTTDSLSGTPWHVWYDTTNNVINRYTADGTTPNPGQSFPIAIVTVSGGQITSIDQVFNGFGYIGSTVFALPGVRGLIPNGRNADGSLNNILTTPATTVKTSTVVSGNTGRKTMAITSNGVIDRPGGLEYNEKENINYNFGSRSGQCACGHFTVGSDYKITDFVVKTPFHAVDYNDSEYIAHQGMPSNRYVNLTLGASGTLYTAPADGYFSAIGSTTADSWIFFRNNQICQQATEQRTGYGIRCAIDASKGDSVKFEYENYNSVEFKFVYANGAK